MAMAQMALMKKKPIKPSQSAWKRIAAKVRCFLKMAKYCKIGNFRCTFNFALFALKLATTKIKTSKYILYMSPSMEQKSKITNKKTSKLALNWLTAKMYMRGYYHFYIFVTIFRNMRNTLIIII